MTRYQTVASGTRAHARWLAWLSVCASLGCRSSLDLDRYRFDAPGTTDESLSPDAGANATGQPNDPASPDACVFGRSRLGNCQLRAR